MVEIFPTRLFGFLETEYDIERQTLKGGTALSGEQDVISTDGGGRVFAELSDGSLVDRGPTLAWRALLTQLEEGVTPIVVPFCDARYTPYATGGGHVPHSDKTPFADQARYFGSGFVSTVGAAALRATSLALSPTLPRPLIGGEWFSIEHPTKGWRAYRIASVDGATVTFRPPLREAVPNDAAVEFAEPKCLMVQDGRASSRKQGHLTPAAIRFVEAP